MFDNVLVGVDGRSGGRDAIALARQLTGPEGRLTLVHAHSGELRPTRAVTPGLTTEEREASAALLEGERAEANVRAELVSVAAMSPGRALHQQAEEQQGDLLVVGSTSRGVFGRATLGDDTRAALNGAPCAVAIAPLGYAEHPASFVRIGVAYNGSPESEGALAMARTLAVSTGARVLAREVVSIPSYAYGGLLAPSTGEELNLAVKEANERLGSLTDVEGSAVYGIPGEGLAEFGEEVDILVVGSRGYGPLRRLVLGSTSEYLERHARCPLLVLPRGDAIGEPHVAGDAQATVVG